MNGKVKVQESTRTPSRARTIVTSAIAGLLLAGTVGACSVASGATVRNGSLDRPAGVGPVAAPAPVVTDESYESLSRRYARANAPAAVVMDESFDSLSKQAAKAHAPAALVMDESFQSLSQQYAKAPTTGLSSTGAAHKESNRQEDRNR